MFRENGKGDSPKILLTDKKKIVRAPLRGALQRRSDACCAAHAWGNHT